MLKPAATGFLRVTLGDALVIVALGCVIAMLGWRFWFGIGDAPAHINIRVGGQVAHQIAFANLDAPLTQTVTGRLGISRIEVSRDGARFVESPCPHHHCIRAGRLNRVGTVAFCLPNGVGIEVISESPGYDSISY